MNPTFKDTVWAPRPACCYDPPTVVAPLTVQRGRPAAHDSDPYDTITENMPDVDVPRFPTADRFV